MQMNCLEDHNQSCESLKAPKDGDHEFRSGNQSPRHCRGIHIARHLKLLMRRRVKEPGLIPGWEETPTKRFRPAQGGEKQLTLLEALLTLSLRENLRHEPIFSSNIARPCCQHGPDCRCRMEAPCARRELGEFWH
jgi:hypothetical protein